MLTTKQKLISTVVIMIIVILCVYLYFHFTSKKNETKKEDIDNIDNIDKVIDNKSKKNPLPDSFKGIYLYSTKNDTLYLLTTDQKYYNAGKLTDCPRIKDNKNDTDVISYEISDITTLYNCIDTFKIPEKYRDKCVDHKDGWIKVVLKDAETLEEYIKKNIKGDITPDVKVCYPSSDMGNINMGGDSTWVIKAYHSLEDFLTTNRDGILMLFAGKAEHAENVILSAVGETMSKYFLIVMTIQGFMSDNKWAREKTGIMTGQMVLDWMIPKIETTITNFLKNDAKTVIEESGGNIVSVSTELSIKATTTILENIGELSLKLLSGAGKILSVVGYIQLFGMVLDMLGICNLSSLGNNLSQQYMDSIQQSSDLSLSINTGGMTSSPWDPLKNYCDFDIIPDKEICKKRYNECSLSTEDKKKTVDEYCKEVNEKFDSYMKEYLSNLTVNSVGQCIKKDGTSNEELSKLFKKCVGGNIDWGVISKVDKNNYPKELLPSNKVLKQLDVLFVNKNEVVQEYLFKYWYLVAGFFGILSITLFSL